MAEATEAKKEEKKKVAPKVAVKSAGRISSTLEGVAAEYMHLHPDRQVRWVYHSATKPELSNLMSRQAEGYRIVKPEEFTGSYIVKPFVDEKGMLRVADAVLMSIPADQREANKLERERMADDQLDTVKNKFHQDMDSVASGSHRSSARGAVKLEEREHSYDIEQRSKEG